MIFHEIQPAIPVEGCASARRANNLTVVVDPGGDSVRVAGGSRELLDVAIFPDDRLELEHRAARVLRLILREPDHFASNVDHVGEAVGAPQRRELSHHAVLPQEWEACSTGGSTGVKPKRLEAAKVFTTIRN